MLDGPFYHLMFCHPLKIVYSPIPKAGCSSIKSYLRDQMGLPKFDPIREVHNRVKNGFSYAHQIERENLIQILFANNGGYFKFTVCRNPYARLFSAYNDLVVAPAGGVSRGGKAVDALRLTYCNIFDKRPSEVPTLNFEMFIRAIAAHSPENLDRHWQLQSVLNCANLIRYDMVIKLEEIASKSVHLARRAGLTKPLDLHLNTGPQFHENLKNYYTEEMKDIVAKTYARDFVRFRYDPDILP